MRKEYYLSEQPELDPLDEEADTSIEGLTAAIQNIDMEAFPSFVKIKDFFSGLLTHINDFFKGLAPIEYAVNQRDVRSAIAKLTKIRTHNISGFTVYVPEGLVGYMATYLQFVNNSIIELSSIDARLLRPLEMWASNVISDPSYKDKIWVNTFGTPVDVKNIKNELRKFFTSDTQKAQSATVKYLKAFHDTSDVQDVNVLLDKIVVFSDTLISGKLHKRVDLVSGLLKEIVDKRLLETMDVKKTKSITDMVGQLASELELLSLLVFQVKTASEAYAKTIEKINTQLT